MVIPNRTRILLLQRNTRKHAHILYMVKDIYTNVCSESNPIKANHVYTFACVQKKPVILWNRPRNVGNRDIGTDECSQWIL